MASVINGTNIVLYYINPNPTFYFNASTSTVDYIGDVTIKTPKRYFNNA